MSSKNLKPVPPGDLKKKGTDSGSSNKASGSNNKGKTDSGKGTTSSGKSSISNSKTSGSSSKGSDSNDKNKKPMKDEVKKALSYNKNTPMMIMVGIFLFFIMYNLLKHMRNKDDIMKHKINTEIRRKLYFKDEYDGA